MQPTVTRGCQGTVKARVKADTTKRPPPAQGGGRRWWRTEVVAGKVGEMTPGLPTLPLTLVIYTVNILPAPSN